MLSAVTAYQQGHVEFNGTKNHLSVRLGIESCTLKRTSVIEGAQSAESLTQRHRLPGTQMLAASRAHPSTGTTLLQAFLDARKEPVKALDVYQLCASSFVCMPVQRTWRCAGLSFQACGPAPRSQILGLLNMMMT